MKDKILLLSHIIGSSTPSYGNRDKVVIRRNTSISSGDSANTSTYFISNNHIGTHIDAPNHFSNQGAKLFDFPAETWFFDRIGVVEIEVEDGQLIEWEDVDHHCNKIDENIEILLIKTGFENYRNEVKYWEESPGLHPRLADVLRDKFPNIRCVGFDFISLTSWRHRSYGKEAHLSFLSPDDPSKTLLVVEDMRLSQIVSNLKSLVIAPHFYEDGNGGGVTIFAKEG
jgi:arylformamidase